MRHDSRRHQCPARQVRAIADERTHDPRIRRPQILVVAVTANTTSASQGTTVARDPPTAGSVVRADPAADRSNFRVTGRSWLTTYPAQPPASGDRRPSDRDLVRPTVRPERADRVRSRVIVDLPAAFVKQSVVEAAEQQQVADVGAAAAGPWDEVVGVGPGRRCTASREPATMVADVQRLADPMRNDPVRAADVHRLPGCRVEYEPPDVGVAGHPLGERGGHVADPGELSRAGGSERGLDQTTARQTTAGQTTARRTTACEATVRRTTVRQTVLSRASSYDTALRSA